MPKHWRWIVVGSGILAAGALAISLSSTALPTVRFADGASTRIIKVVVGTNHVFAPEPFWKEACRRVLPKSLGSRFGSVRQFYPCLLYDSLAIHLEPLPFKNSNRRSAMSVEVIFPDGTTSQSFWGPQVHPLFFSDYPREQKRIHLRFNDGNHPVDVTVPNPRPTRRDSWSAKPVPVTNYVPGTEVVLQYLRYPTHSSVIRSRSTVGGDVGSMQWRMCLFDQFGNWDPARPFPGAKREREFKLLAEGTEVLPVGFVEAPTNQQYQVLPVSPRMTNCGISFMCLFGPGTYDITDAFDIKTHTGEMAARNTVDVTDSGWVVRCSVLSIVAILEKTKLDVRIRQHLPPTGEGLLYANPIGASTKARPTSNVFLVQPPANNRNKRSLEAEVIVRWPAVEFFVRKPE